MTYTFFIQRVTDLKMFVASTGTEFGCADFHASTNFTLSSLEYVQEEMFFSYVSWGWKICWLDVMKNIWIYPHWKFFMPVADKLFYHFL
jgi:hypothetical protein